MRRDSVKKIMKDSSQDAEVRIVAYLMRMKCPDFGVITEVKKLVATEEVNQGNTFCEQCQIVFNFFKPHFIQSDHSCGHIKTIWLDLHFRPSETFQTAHIYFSFSRFGSWSDTNKHFFGIRKTIQNS